MRERERERECVCVCMCLGNAQTQFGVHVVDNLEQSFHKPLVSCRFPCAHASLKVQVCGWSGPKIPVQLHVKKLRNWCPQKAWFLVARRGKKTTTTEACWASSCVSCSTSRGGPRPPSVGAGATKWPDTPNEEAQASSHFKSHLKWSNTQQGSEWYFQGVSDHFWSDIKCGDIGRLTVSGPI